MKKTYCKQCGEVVNLQHDFCVNCGKKFKKYDLYDRFSSQEDIRAVKYREPIIIKKLGPFKKKTAMNFCIFGGLFGAHKFYEKKFIIGLIYICSLGLFGLGWIIDLIKISRMPNQYYTVKVIKMREDG